MSDDEDAAERDRLDPKWVGREWLKYMRAQLAGEAGPPVIAEESQEELF